MRKKNWAKHLIHLYENFQPPALPEGIGWLFPQAQPEVRTVFRNFCQKFFNDDQPRRLLIGINPGRFGAGVTGVNFTAPKQLTEFCGIDHPFTQQSELSAEFIYEMIEAYGGAAKFYAHHFIGSVCPLGFVKGGKNLNYYDDPALLQAVEPFIIQGIEKLLEAQVERKLCICIGGEKNFKYLTKLNQRFNWFQRIDPVAHPRFVMQYRRKQKEQFIQDYLRLLKK
jgi:hypothetical protein